MEEFLRANDLGHLSTTFEEQNITELGLLELLSEQEIEKLVMGNIGDKLRLRRGIHNLKKVELETERTSEENYEPPSKIQIIEKDGLREASSITLEPNKDTPAVTSFIDSQLETQQDLPIIIFSEPLHESTPDYNSPNTSTVTLDSAFSQTSENNAVVENISVKEILTKDFLGQALLSKGQGPNGSLNNSDRDKLCDILVTRLLNVFHGKLTLHHFRVVSKKITEILPKEKQSTYFIEPILKKDSRRNRSEPARGKLIEKYRNKLYLIRKLEKSDATRGEECDKIDGVFDQSVRDSKIWLSKNSTPRVDVLLHWKASYCIRKLTDTTIADYFQEWPILKEDIAPELVAYDFEQLHPTAQLNVEVAFDAMFAEVYEKRKKTLTSTDDAIYSLLESTEVTADSKKAIQLFLLPSLLPPKTRTNKGKKCWKPSITEARDSLVVHVKIPGDVLEAKNQQVEFAYSKGISVQPYILLIGPSLNNITSALVVINQLEFKCHSVISALEFCFKVYQVLDAQYPVASQHIWYLIQWKIFKYHTRKDIQFPNLNEFI